MLGSFAFGGPDVLGKTDDVSVESLNNKSGDECFSDTFSETTETASQENQECPNSSSESVLVDVPNVESSGTPLETVAESKSQVDSHDTYVEETCVDEISTYSQSKNKSESINKEKEVEINEQSLTNVSENKTEIETPIFQNDHDHSKKDESHPPATSHACASSDQ
ncbi:hypothetical protein Hanom_Chr13g01197441 [Helianthus anomalus]